MDNFTKIVTGWIKQYFEPNKDGTFVCTSQEFMAGDIVEYEDDYQEPVGCQVHQYQPYDMVQPEPIVDCEHCCKCGENTCGNDTQNHKCFEPF